MFRPRVIPTLLLKGKGLVKSVKFKDHRYIGDPLNAVKIFNDKRADELIFLDVFATKEGRTISADLVQMLGDECNMPFTVGGGIQTLEQIRLLLRAGAEKVALNAYAASHPEFIKQASEEFGSSTIVVSMDVHKKKFFGGQRVFVQNGTKATLFEPVEYARLMQSMGAGELLVNSVERDGMMTGYDTSLVGKISHEVDIPVIACGGAGNVADMAQVIESGASAAAAGSMFVFHGPRRAVLISLPSKGELKEKLGTTAL